MVSVASSLSLRQANSGDVALLVWLRNDLAPFFISTAPATAEQTARLLAASKTYIIERDGERIGSFAFYNLNGTEAEFGRFMVERRLHGLGWGIRAMELAVVCARELGFKSLRLTVRTDNTLARDLYTRVGFRTTGHLNRAVEMRIDL